MKETTDETTTKVPDTTDWEDLEKFLHSTMAKEQQKPGRAKIMVDIFKAVIRLAKESPGTLNLKITATVLRELRYSFKMFYPHRYAPKITHVRIGTSAAGDRAIYPRKELRGRSGPTQLYDHYRRGPGNHGGWK